MLIKPSILLFLLILVLSILLTPSTAQIREDHTAGSEKAGTLHASALKTLTASEQNKFERYCTHEEMMDYLAKIKASFMIPGGDWTNSVINLGNGGALTEWPNDQPHARAGNA